MSIRLNGLIRFIDVSSLGVLDPITRLSREKILIKNFSNFSGKLLLKPLANRFF